MKVLLSPAKSIRSTSLEGNFPFTAPFFLNDAEKLMGKMKKLSAKKIMDIMHVSQEIAELNVERNQAWSVENHEKSTDTPITSFSGEVYRGFDFESLAISQYNRLQDTVRILSGLYGVLKPFDRMQSYRLEMGTKWEITPKIKNNYLFWKDKPTNFLKNELQSDELVVNLASTEYSKVIQFKSIKNKVITPVFKDFRNGNLSVVMMFAKHARGEMARWIVDQHIQHEEELKLFQGGGYQWDAINSTETEWVFIR